MPTNDFLLEKTVHTDVNIFTQFKLKFGKKFYVHFNVVNWSIYVRIVLYSLCEVHKV